MVQQTVGQQAVVQQAVGLPVEARDIEEGEQGLEQVVEIISLVLPSTADARAVGLGDHHNLSTITGAFF